jgi:hypothetical protein
MYNHFIFDYIENIAANFSAMLEQINILLVDLQM